MQGTIKLSKLKKGSRFLLNGLNYTFTGTGPGNKLWSIQYWVLRDGETKERQWQRDKLVVPIS